MIKVRAISYLQTGEFDNQSVSKSLQTKIFNSDQKFLPFLQERDSLGRLISTRRETLIHKHSIQHKRQSISLFLDSTIHTSANESQADNLDSNMNKQQLLLSNLALDKHQKSEIKKYISVNKYLSQKDEDDEDKKAKNRSIENEILDKFFSYDIRLIQKKRIELLNNQQENKSQFLYQKDQGMLDSIDEEKQLQQKKHKYSQIIIQNIESPHNQNHQKMKLLDLHKTEKIERKGRSLEQQPQVRDESEKMFSKLLNQVDKEVKIEQKNASKFIHPFEKISVFPIGEKFALENKMLFASYLEKANTRTKNLKILSDKMKDVVEYRRYNGIRDPEERIF